MGDGEGCGSGFTLTTVSHRGLLFGTGRIQASRADAVTETMIVRTYDPQRPVGPHL
jgi:hypothetical protein